MTRPHRKPAQDNFERPFPWPLPCTKVGPINLSKLRQSDLKSQNVQKLSFLLITMDLLANPNKIDENTHFQAQ